MEEIITYIIDRIEKRYLLYDVCALKKIVDYENYKKFNLEEKEKIIIQLLNLLKFNSLSANFKFLDQKYSGSFGRKKNMIIEKAIIISKSVTGIRESRSKYEF